MIDGEALFDSTEMPLSRIEIRSPKMRRSRGISRHNLKIKAVTPLEPFFICPNDNIVMMVFKNPGDCCVFLQVVESRPNDLIQALQPCNLHENGQFRVDGHGADVRADVERARVIPYNTNVSFP